MTIARQNGLTASGLELEKDVATLHHWLGQVLSSEPPPETIKAFCFGLFNPVRGNGVISCDLYVSGSRRFDPNDNDSDWACWTPDSYFPRSRHADSSALHEIYQLVSGTEVAQPGEYVLCLGYACLAIHRILDDLPLDPSLPVAVGFDEGDFIMVRSGEPK